MGGFFGTISKSECINDLYYGTDYHSHMGTKRGGLCTIDNENKYIRKIHNIEKSYFRNKFENDIKLFKGKMGIGIISDYDSQPLIINSHLGKFSIVTIGKIVNIKELEIELLKNHKTFTESSKKINPTELISMLISEKDSFKNGIKNVFNKIKGSCSMMLLTKNGIIIARDKLGRTPIVLGKRDDDYAIASETCSFPNLGYDIYKYIGPGEIGIIDSNGYKQLKKPGKKMQLCSFLWVYYGFPNSNYENINVELCRYKCGKKIAENDDTKCDFVADVPDSGVAHAIGYSNKKQIPYRRPYIKYSPTWSRSFMPQKQFTRDIIANKKLIPNKDIIKNKKIVFCDDSIVRGTQLRDNIKYLHKYGIKEVHIRLACPPLIFPCKFLNFSISHSSIDLAARRIIKEMNDDNNLNDYIDSNSDKYIEMINRIKENMNVTSLKFQNLDDLVDAIGLPKEKLCTHCWDNSSYF